MATEVTAILNIINTHISKYQEAMDEIIDYELDMADWGCPISKKLQRSLDKRWTEYVSIKSELTRVRDEIMTEIYATMS